MFIYLLNFTKKCTGGQIKAFSFLFCTACDAKSTKGASVNIQSDGKTTCKKKTDSSSVFTCSGKIQGGEL